MNPIARRELGELGIDPCPVCGGYLPSSPARAELEAYGAIACTCRPAAGETLDRHEADQVLARSLDRQGATPGDPDGEKEPEL